MPSMENQRGFTLVEMVVAVACAAILLAAGGALLASMHPGALRAAQDDFDANLAAAKAIAASSGNGATIAIVPRTDVHGSPLPGFIARVYAGRPNVANGVQPTNVFPLESSVAISERTLGKPPFAIFLSSAGHPSGLAAYPSVDSGGNPSFTVLAAQPPCPARAIVLTFANAQNATATRTLPCSVSVAGSSAPAASPTPNAPVVVPAKLVAHWTSDAAALRFVAAEFGYTHWFASNTGSTCGSVATYSPGWPYSSPPNAAEAIVLPNPPPAPFSYPNNGGASMNDAPAPFRMVPVANSPGLCAIDIVDDYGQHAGASVQVMGDLSANPAALTFSSPGAAAQTVVFAKSYDAEDLNLMWGGSCGSLISIAQSARSTQPSPTTAATTATLTVAPKGSSGSCSLTVSDQYGEPLLAIPVVIASSAMNTWPEQIVMASQGGSLAMAKTRVASAATPMHGCLAQALMADGVTVDPAPSQALALGIHTDPTSGCYTDATGTPVQAQAVVYEPGGHSANYNASTGCGGLVILGSWSPGASGVQAALGVRGGSAATSCQIALSDGSSSTPALDHGIVNAQVVQAGFVLNGLFHGHCTIVAGVQGCISTLNIGVAGCNAGGITAWDPGGDGDVTVNDPVSVTVPSAPPTTQAGWSAVLTNAWETIANGYGSVGSHPLQVLTGSCSS